MSRKDRRDRDRSIAPSPSPAAAAAAAVKEIAPPEPPAPRQLGHFVRHTYVNGELVNG